jgi:Ca2+-binding RTX toxin-like protein
MSTITGSIGNDTLQGNGDDDLIEGFGGNDILSGGAGDNRIFGGAGDDVFHSGGLFGAGLDSLYGGAGNDVFNIQSSALYAVIEGGDGPGERDTLRLISETGDGANIGFTSGQSGSFGFAGGAGGVFSQIEGIEASEGDDTINASGAGQGVHVLGGGGHDFFTGSIGDDTFDGGAGTDEVFAAEGDDSIEGGTGDDFIYGGTGNDALFAGADNDYMQGDAGNDTVVAGDGDDFIRGDAGNDFVYGGAGDDNTYGGLGNDHVYGGDGDDHMFGGFGDDTVYGGSGNDVITGSGEADLVFGGDGDDLLQGSNGNDTFHGEAGADTMFGDDDADVFYAGSGDFVDGGETTLTGSDNDTLHLTDVHHVQFDPFNTEMGTAFFNDGSSMSFTNVEQVVVDGVPVLPPDFVVTGTDGADGIDAAYTGDPQGDRVDGNDNLFGSNDDVIRALAGNDSVVAGEGSDIVYGGTGDDTLRGGIGDDRLFGDQGNDLIKGEDGHDTLTGGAGADTMIGGEGRDQFYSGAGDVVDGGSTGDDYDVLDVTQAGFPGTRIIYDADNAENGTIEFLDRDGNIIDRLRFTDIERVIACFTPGTLVQTNRGEVAVERLRPEDRVMTRDHGMQTVRWVGRRDLAAHELLIRPEFLPVRIAAGALGPGFPARDMAVSPQHRMLISGHRAELLFGVGEVLVAALHLIGLPGIDRSVVSGVSYIHLLFDQHEIILADGVWSESFQPGMASLDGMDEAQRDEILELFPELGQLQAYPTARMALRGRESRVLFAM